MKTLPALAAVMTLSVASFAAHAQTDPYPGPASTGDGALLVSIWDSTANVSLVYSVPGLDFSGIVNGSSLTDGFNIAVPDFATQFGGSNPSDVMYSVTAAGLDGDFAQQAFAITGPTGGVAATYGGVSGAFTYFDTFNSNLHQACGSATPCETADPNSGVWAGTNDDNVAAQLKVSPSGTLGNALGFYYLHAAASRNRGTDPDLVQSLGQWLLDGAGDLTFSANAEVVPLPAAVWLLSSGLVAFGAISRRRPSRAAA